MEHQGYKYYKVYDSFSSYNNSDNYLVLVIYDISCDQKRNKIAKILESFGVRVQKSAFEAVLDKQRYSKLIKQLGRLLDDEDCVRVYKFTGNTEMVVWGTIENIKDEEFLIL
ncbi:MAG: CRISPR-associated endonuclease Cas2 [Syntrophomonadaceae bacterium]|nr:CRISPR-associated endonuclease Cas2 [Syntrophomonadaceae bacterium]